MTKKIWQVFRNQLQRSITTRTVESVGEVDFQEIMPLRKVVEVSPGCMDSCLCTHRDTHPQLPRSEKDNGTL